MFFLLPGEFLKNDVSHVWLLSTLHFLDDVLIFSFDPVIAVVVLFLVSLALFLFLPEFLEKLAYKIFGAVFLLGFSEQSGVVAPQLRLL